GARGRTPDGRGLAGGVPAGEAGKPENPFPLHPRPDRPAALGDLPVRLADRDGPVRRAAHHHALEDGLPADGGAHDSLGLPAGLLEPPLEALDAAARVHQLLLARVERVAGRADLDVELGLRGARLELVAARAANGREDVLGMDAGLHCPARIATAVS